MTSMRILRFFMMRKKKFLFFLRSLVKGQAHSFFKDLMGVFCTVGGTLVSHLSKLNVFIMGGPRIILKQKEFLFLKTKMLDFRSHTTFDDSYFMKRLRF
jgi:hypothetical protein